MKHQLLKEAENIARKALNDELKKKGIDINQDPTMQIALNRLLEIHHKCEAVSSQYVSFE